jgi:hypothetical protein
VDEKKQPEILRFAQNDNVQSFSAACWVISPAVRLFTFSSREGLAVGFSREVRAAMISALRNQNPAD